MPLPRSPQLHTHIYHPMPMRPYTKKARRRVCRAFVENDVHVRGREGKTRMSRIGSSNPYASWETGRSRISWQLPQVNTPRWWHCAHHLVASF